MLAGAMTQEIIQDPAACSSRSGWSWG